jgi:hypothetical protein
MYRVELKAARVGKGKGKGKGFLMYRVELKAQMPTLQPSSGLYKVPNVPCGVERSVCQVLFNQVPVFLMYRVELKVLRFLRYRSQALGS